MTEIELEKFISNAISSAPVGKKVEVRFSGVAVPIEIKMKFAGGWVINYILIPGMPLEFIKGEAGYLNEVGIALLPNDGLK
ncbi:MAG: hypothetical protein HY272_01910 [Gammaproteobacteria bacterium]|nr:hypothetical protein [Gammaproteobacteria bacterium]